MAMMWLQFVRRRSRFIPIAVYLPIPWTFRHERSRVALRLTLFGTQNNVDSFVILFNLDLASPTLFRALASNARNAFKRPFPRYVRDIHQSPHCLRAPSIMIKQEEDYAIYRNSCDGPQNDRREIQVADILRYAHQPLRACRQYAGDESSKKRDDHAALRALATNDSIFMFRHRASPALAPRRAPQERRVLDRLRLARPSRWGNPAELSI